MEAGATPRPAGSQGSWPSRAAGVLGAHAGPIAIVGALFVAFTWIGWLRWADPIVDWGRQVYLAWQIAAGKVLYRDLASTYGPLSPYLNAALFRLFGTSIRTLVVAGLALLALDTALVYRLLSSVATRWTATASCAAFLAVFGFGHDLGLGNYNYVCPYCHEITHGMTLSLVSLLFLLRYVRRRGVASAALAGGACGLVAMTKPELAVACLAALATGLAGAWAIDRPAVVRRVADAAALLAGIAAPLAAAFGLFLTAVGPRTALLSTFGAWLPLFNRGVRSIPFYAIGVGGQEGAANAVRALAWATLLLAYLALVWGIGAVARRRGWPQRPVAVIVGVAAFALLAWALLPTLWIGVAKPLPLVVAAVAALAVVTVRDPSRERAARRSGVVLLCLAVFALVALVKMAFTVYLGHFGFVLAMPGALVFLVALLELLPARADARGSSRPVVLAGGVALAMFVVSTHAGASILSLRAKTASLGAGSNRIVTTPEMAGAVSAMLDLVAREVPPGETLAVLPEGGLLNYFAGRRNPTRFLMLTPTEFANYGEAPVAREFRLHPPFAILYLPPEGPQMGVGFFGEQYGRPLAEWIRANYSVVARSAPAAAGARTPAYVLLRRVAPAGPAAAPASPG